MTHSLLAGMIYPRTGHVSALLNEEIWSCGGTTSGEVYEETNQAYKYDIYRTGNDFLNNFPEYYTGLDKHEITRKLWARRNTGWR